MVMPVRTPDPSQTRASGVHALGFTGDDSALARALRRGHPGAPAALFDRYGRHVEGVLINLLGFDGEHEDLLHEIFAQALTCINKLQDDERLKAWLTSIAVHTARSCLRRRQRFRLFLRRAAQQDLPVSVADAETRRAVGRVYRLLERMPTELRLAFALRFIQGMELTEVAAACDVSLATIKRRLAKARRRFMLAARGDSALASWVVPDQEGQR